MAARYLAQSDLEAVVGAQRILQLFDDDNSGVLSAAELVNVVLVLEQAEAQVDSVMMLAYSNDLITDLANADAVFKYHASWIALEFSAERRGEFGGEKGEGPYSTQFTRAMQFFKQLSKGRKRSKGESAAGVGANVGGNLNPTLPADANRFTFAPDDDNPTGHGGF